MNIKCEDWTEQNDWNTIYLSDYCDILKTFSWIISSFVKYSLRFIYLFDFKHDLQFSLIFRYLNFENVKIQRVVQKHINLLI